MLILLMSSTTWFNIQEFCILSTQCINEFYVGVMNKLGSYFPKQ